MVFWPLHFGGQVGYSPSFAEELAPDPSSNLLGSICLEPSMEGFSEIPQLKMLQCRLLLSILYRSSPSQL